MAKSGKMWQKVAKCGKVKFFKDLYKQAETALKRVVTTRNKIRHRVALSGEVLMLSAELLCLACIVDILVFNAIV